MTANPRSRRKVPETPGETLKLSILEMFDLNPAEQVMLNQAAVIVDALERINAEVTAGSLTDIGSAGQTTAAPLLGAQRQHAEILVKLLDALRLPAVDEEEGRPSASKLAQRAALVRWAREREKGA